MRFGDDESDLCRSDLSLLAGGCFAAEKPLPVRSEDVYVSDSGWLAD